MTDISNFLLRWEIDNATATFATGKAESGVFDKGGFRWIARVERRGPQNGTINFSLQCDSVNNRRWKCEAKVAVLVLHSSGVFGQWIEDNFIYNENTCLWILKSMFRWNYLTDPAYMISDKVTMEFRINIISSQRGDPIADPETFTVSNRMSNVILKIGGRKLHVSKEYLAVHSPVFETLFFGDFAEKGKEEVEIKDVVYEEFVYLLNIIYVRTMDITDGTVQHILKLADQFQMEAILDQLKKYLSQSTGIDVVTKLILADQFRLVALRDHCLNSFNNIADLTGKLKSSPEYANFSDDMKARISRAGPVREASHPVEGIRCDEKKNLLADEYRFTSLKDHCLNSFTSLTDLTAKLNASPEFDNFSSDMQAAICKRMVKLT